ncbi:MAG: hypothetical protein QM765_31790 [Myxococcales bacterium]
MGYSFVWGRCLRLATIWQKRGDKGRESQEIVGDPIDSTNMAYSSFAALVEATRVLGIPEDAWPYFPGLPDARIPLDQVRERSTRLRRLLEALPPEAISSNIWLEKISGYLRDGYDLFIAD